MASTIHIKYDYILTGQFWTLKDTTSPGQRGPGSNDKEGVLHNLDICVSPPDAVKF